jgi:hypothetical protein
MRIFQQESRFQVFRIQKICYYFRSFKRKRERERERELLSTLALSLPARERKRELLSALALSLLLAGFILLVQRGRIWLPWRGTVYTVP